MATVPNQILSAFCARLGTAEEIDAETIEALRVLLRSGNKLKADDFVAALEHAVEEGPQ